MWNLGPSILKHLCNFTDCPQVQCTRKYTATEPDELTLEESDVVNVFKKMADGKTKNWKLLKTINEFSSEDLHVQHSKLNFKFSQVAILSL